jgi:hypothetical protein
MKTKYEHIIGKANNVFQVTMGENPGEIDSNCSLVKLFFLDMMVKGHAKKGIIDFIREGLDETERIMEKARSELEITDETIINGPNALNDMLNDWIKNNLETI